MTAIIETTTAPASRKASRPVRRQQLIDATIVVLARKGYSALTVADVAKTAGLSVGIINFHFESKEKLLASCLTHLAEEYYRNWQEALAVPGASVAEKLQMVILGDFNDKIFTPDKLAAWIAFWGETQGRPVYTEICSAYDEERAKAVGSLCEKIIKDGGYKLVPNTVMRALESLGDGLWLGVAAGNSQAKFTITASQARQALQAMLVSFFPKHFPS
ncbi:MAG: TetR/AcrR family transcriptional regulator [Aestuariivirga sp.]|nr:TetR/AcrR family transcriptional regulator [Aestuariivirga sp.]